MYFEGKIEGLEVLSINGDKNDERIKIMQGNSFKGYFKGFINMYH